MAGCLDAFVSTSTLCVVSCAQHFIYTARYSQLNVFKYVIHYFLKNAHDVAISSIIMLNDNCFFVIYIYILLLLLLLHICIYNLYMKCWCCALYLLDK